MIFKLTPNVQKQLLSLPETGMGYQIIEARKHDKSFKERYLVYNCELIVEHDKRFVEFREKIITEGYKNVLGKAGYLHLDINTISLVARRKITEVFALTEKERKEKGRHSGGSGATENPKERADGEEVFTRLSPYEDDIRIDLENKKLKPGAFTTTYVDYQTCLKYNDDPIDRYALPSDEKIKWAFFIQPKQTDFLQRGIVQPAFGHDGGGIETYFEKGTANSTCYGKKPYGES